MRSGLPLYLQAEMACLNLKLALLIEYNSILVPLLPPAQLPFKDCASSIHMCSDILVPAAGCNLTARR